MWGTKGACYPSLRQEVRICVWGQVGVFGTPATIPTPMLALDFWFLRPFTSIVSVMETQKEDGAGSLTHFRDGTTEAWQREKP